MIRKCIVPAALVAAVLVPAGAFGQPMTVDEVVKLIDNNISDNVIVAQIEETNSYFHLSTDDLIRLKGAGATDNLVNYLISRKPGGAPPTGGTAGTGGTTGTSFNVAGRTGGNNGETPPPLKKFSDLTVTVTGRYVVTSLADLNVFYAAFIDGEKKYYVDQWKQIYSVMTPETGRSTTKRVFEPGSFSIKIPTGEHTLSLVMWSGPGTIDDNTAKAYVVYSKKISVAEGLPTVVNLSGETDAAGKFIIR